jgi:D-arabinose 1-dehydrogenase-like Zn-dependent alcohol dehydrogenase
MTLTVKQIDLLGSLGGSNEDNAEVLELMAAGKLRSRTTCIGFDEIGEAIRQLERGEITTRLAVLYD